MTPFDFTLSTRLVFGPGTLNRLGELARALGFRRPLLVADPGLTEPTGDYLAARLVEIGKAAGFPVYLRTAGVRESDLATLAETVSPQWTSTFNPQPFGPSDALEVYQCAY